MKTVIFLKWNLFQIYKKNKSAISSRKFEERFQGQLVTCLGFMYSDPITQYSTQVDVLITIPHPTQFLLHNMTSSWLYFISFSLVLWGVEALWLKIPLRKASLYSFLQRGLQQCTNGLTWSCLLPTDFCSLKVFASTVICSNWVLYSGRNLGFERDCWDGSLHLGRDGDPKKLSRRSTRAGAHHKVASRTFATRGKTQVQKGTKLTLGDKF